eukprot:1160419-Pelagomonas_calceolata.AAC.5
MLRILIIGMRGHYGLLKRPCLGGLHSSSAGRMRMYEAFTSLTSCLLLIKIEHEERPVSSEAKLLGVGWIVSQAPGRWSDCPQTSLSANARKNAFLIALKTGQARHACEQLHREYRAEAQRAKQRYTRTRAAEFMCKLFQKDPAVHKHLKKPVSSSTTPISEQAWRDHINDLLSHSSPSYIETHGSHNGASEGTGPHPFNLPGEVELTSLVSKHIPNMSSTSSPGFDTVLPPFIKQACKLVPKHHGRGLENYNVLAPYISQLFTLMLKTARIPSSWKAAKLAPIYKKGPVTRPSNYQMLAVSNTLHRLYTNVLRSIIQDWCAKYSIIPDNQFGFFPGRNSLQPLFLS